MGKITGKYDMTTDTYKMKCPYADITYKTNKELSNNFNKLYNILSMGGNKVPLYIKDDNRLKLKYEDNLLDICMDVDNEDHVNTVGPKIVGYTLGKEYIKEHQEEKLDYLSAQIMSHLGLPRHKFFEDNVAEYVCYIYNKYLINIKTYPNAYGTLENNFKKYWNNVYNTFMGADHLSLHRNLGLLLFGG
jgi:hypothetical protein